MGAWPFGRGGVQGGQGPPFVRQASGRGRSVPAPTKGVQPTMDCMRLVHWQGHFPLELSLVQSSGLMPPTGVGSRTGHTSRGSTLAL